MPDIDQISGIEAYEVAERVVSEQEKDQLYSVPGGKVFLVMRPKTLEVRTDAKLSRLLREKYETVMESRYFGRGGIEIVNTGQLEPAELEDLVRLSYNLTKELEE